MALIKCTECGHEISDKAEACPNCGCPIEKQFVEEIEKSLEAEVNESTQNNLTQPSKADKDTTELLRAFYDEHKVFVIASVCIFLFVFLLSMCTGSKATYPDTTYYGTTDEVPTDTCLQEESTSASIVGKYTFTDDKQTWTLEIKPDETCILTDSTGRERYGSWSDYTENIGSQYYSIDLRSEYKFSGKDNANLYINGKEYDTRLLAIDKNIEWIYESSFSCDAKSPNKRLKLTRIDGQSIESAINTTKVDVETNNSSGFIGKYTFTDDRQKWTLEIKPDETCILKDAKGRIRYGSWGDLTEAFGYYDLDFRNEHEFAGKDNAHFYINGEEYDVYLPHIDANIEWIYESSFSCEAKHPKKRLKLTRIDEQSSKKTVDTTKANTHSNN